MTCQVSAKHECVCAHLLGLSSSTHTHTHRHDSSRPRHSSSPHTSLVSSLVFLTCLVILPAAHSPWPASLLQQPQRPRRSHRSCPSPANPKLLQGRVPLELAPRQMVQALLLPMTAAPALQPQVVRQLQAVSTPGYHPTQLSAASQVSSNNSRVSSSSQTNSSSSHGNSSNSSSSLKQAPAMLMSSSRRGTACSHLPQHQAGQQRGHGVQQLARMTHQAAASPGNGRQSSNNSPNSSSRSRSRIRMLTMHQHKAASPWQTCATHCTPLCSKTQLPTLSVLAQSPAATVRSRQVLPVHPLVRMQCLKGC